MRLLRGLHNAGIQGQGCVATIGNFDGVHFGHQAIIRQVVTKAKRMDLPSVIVLFEPQPLEFFKGHEAPARLMRFSEKYRALDTFDVDYICCLNFNHELSGLSAHDFVDRVLVEHLKVKHLVIGDDFRFGGDRQGDFKLLLAAGQQKGFSVENTPTLVSDEGGQDARVSSTYVRQALAQADFEKAEALLGRPYAMVGRVKHGEKLGRQLGFPTANISLNRLAVPLSGVYVVKVKRSNGQMLQGVANIGVKPTVGQFLPVLEVHIFDFKQSIYGEKLSITFLKKVRDEQRFNGIDELKQQIARDIAVAKHFLATK